MFQPLYIAKSRINYDDTEDDRRARLVAYTQEFVFKNVLENYWEKVFGTYVANPKEVNDQIPISDCFTLAMSKKDGEPEGIKVLCLVPQIRCVWDIILASYHLFFPKTFPTTEHVAMIIYKGIKVLKQNDIENFCPQILRYLHGMCNKEVVLEGGNFNWYLTDPLACVWACVRSSALLRAGYSGLETEEEVDLRSEAEKEFNKEREIQRPITREVLDRLYQENLEAAKKYKVLLEGIKILVK